MYHNSTASSYEEICFYGKCQINSYRRQKQEFDDRISNARGFAFQNSRNVKNLQFFKEKTEWDPKNPTPTIGKEPY